MIDFWKKRKFFDAQHSLDSHNIWAMVSAWPTVWWFANVHKLTNSLRIFIDVTFRTRTWFIRNWISFTRIWIFTIILFLFFLFIFFLCFFLSGYFSINFSIYVLKYVFDLYLCQFQYFEVLEWLKMKIFWLFSMLFLQMGPLLKNTFLKIFHFLTILSIYFAKNKKKTEHKILPIAAFSRDS